MAASLPSLSSQLPQEKQKPKIPDHGNLNVIDLEDAASPTARPPRQDLTMALPGLLEDMLLPASASQPAQMNHVVLGFHKRAKEGIWCTFFNDTASECQQALYCLDSLGKHLIILTGAELEHEELVCPLTSIVHMHAFKATEVDAVPSAALYHVMNSPHEADRLVMASGIRQADQKMVSFCILEESLEARDAFILSMSVLSLYWKQIDGGTYS
jgi:hypothetical protein